VKSNFHQQIEVLLEKHGPALWLFARQWCNAADDAVQEAMIELAKLCDFPVNPRAWLFTAVRRRAINIRRTEARRGKHEKFVAEVGEAWYETDPAKGISANEDAYRIQIALQELTQLDREIVVTKIWGEMSFGQIADLVGSSTSAVHRRYHDAIKKLEKSLAIRKAPHDA
jgi:RNA polymerase sigma factor (sigma-70 family)